MNNDSISRQAAIDVVHKDYDAILDFKSDGHTIADSFEDIINALPSTYPRKGKWIKIPKFCGDDISGFIDNHFSCSECKKEAEINPWGFYILSNFCPHCGADMREGEKE